MQSRQEPSTRPHGESPFGPDGFAAFDAPPQPPLPQQPQEPGQYDFERLRCIRGGLCRIRSTVTPLSLETTLVRELFENFSAHSIEQRHCDIHFSHDMPWYPQSGLALFFVAVVVPCIEHPELTPLHIAHYPERQSQSAAVWTQRPASGLGAGCDVLGRTPWLRWVRLENPLGQQHKSSGEYDGGVGLALVGHMYANGLLWHAGMAGGACMGLLSNYVQLSVQLFSVFIVHYTALPPV
jgi:hypothetical protein